MSLQQIQITASYTMTIDARVSKLSEAQDVPHEVLSIVDPHERAVAYVKWFTNLYGGSYVVAISNLKNVEEIK